MKVNIELNGGEFLKAAKSSILISLAELLTEQEEEVKDAVKTVDSVKKQKKEVEKQPEPQPEAQPETKAVTIEDVRTALRKATNAGKQAAVKQLLADFGVDNLTKIAADRLPEVMEKAVLL